MSKISFSSKIRAMSKAKFTVGLAILKLENNSRTENGNDQNAATGTVGIKGGGGGEELRLLSIFSQLF